MALYTYSVSEDFPNDAVHLTKLADEVFASSLAVRPTSVTVEGDVCTIEFTDTVDEPTLDTVVGAHDGIAPTRLKFHASSTMTAPHGGAGHPETRAFTDTNWIALSGVVTSVGFFVLDVTRAIGRVVGEIKTDGTCKLRIVRLDGTPLSAEYEHGDTEGAWEAFSLQTNQPPDEAQTTYKLEGKVVTATSAEIRYASMTLLEVL